MTVHLLMLLMGVALCSGANILAVLPLPLYSHMNGFRPVLEELARRGHNVTVVSPYPRKEPMANYTDVVLNASLAELHGKPSRSGSTVDPLNESFWSILKGKGPFCEQLEDTFLTKPDLLKFIEEDRSHFDIVITETWSCQEALTALSHKYSAHLIGFNTVLLGPVEAHYTGNTMPYSYVPHLKSRSGDHMNFVERLRSSIMNAANVFTDLYFSLPRKESFMREFIKYPGSENVPPLIDMLKNHSILLVDWHLAFSFPRPYLQNIVEFGGSGIKKGSPLPKDLDEYMSGAKDGVILFTLGSMYRSSSMKAETLAKLLSVFSKLKQRVLMKWEKSELVGKPDNVRIETWLPQASILSHPKLVAFMSHAGSHGLFEATYHGVPIIATPLFSDHYHNAKVAESAGYAIVLDINSFSEELLYQSLQKIIYDPKYKQAALRRSRIMKDTPVPLLDNAVYWIEYVLRHDGARHLRPASLDLSWYQYFLLDILALGLLVILVAFAILISCCKLLCCKSARRKAKKNKPKSD